MKTRTLHVNVNFGMTLVANPELSEEVAATRQIARNLSPEKVAALDKETAYKHALAVSDKTDEEFLGMAIRMAVRDFLREDLPREMSDSSLRAKTGDVKVTVTPKKVTPRVDCIHCRVLEGAGQAYKCSTCRNIDEVK